jgi:hypothetical protein
MEKKNIKQEIEKTLNSLEGMQRAEMHGFLFEKIKARLREETGLKATGFSFSWKLAAAFVIIISINIFTCWKYNHSGKVSKNSYTQAQPDDTYTYYNTYTY